MTNYNGAPAVPTSVEKFSVRGDGQTKVTSTLTAGDTVTVAAPDGHTGTVLRLEAGETGTDGTGDNFYLLKVRRWPRYFRRSGWLWQRGVLSSVLVCVRRV